MWEWWRKRQERNREKRFQQHHLYEYYQRDWSAERRILFREECNNPFRDYSSQRKKIDDFWKKRLKDLKQSLIDSGQI